MLRRRDSGESDRRLTLLTREQGKIDVVAKGARKAGSRLAGSSDPLTVARLSLASGKKNLFITQTQPLSSFRGLRTDYARLSYALALAELYSAVVPYEHADPDAYDLLVRSLKALEVHERPAVALVWAEVGLMAQEGFLPRFDASPVSDTPIQEAQAFVSPEAGGYVTHQEADLFPDRLQVRAEVLLGLAKCAEVAEPPTNLKFAEEALIVLYPFWRRIAETPIPARLAVTRELQSGKGS